MEILSLTNLVLFSQQIFFIILGFFGIGFLIGFHELGHFLFCKLFKIRTPSFSIGFGPRLFSKKIGETQFVLSAIPFGGYVEIAGAAEVGQGEQKEAYSKDQYSFAVKPFYQKLLVMSGGILFNFIFAYCSMIFLFMTGIPKTMLMHDTNAIPVISYIQKDSPAFQQELQIGDRIIAVNNTNINNNIQKLLEILRTHANQEATFLIERNGEQLTTTIRVGSRTVGPETFGYLGVNFDLKSTPPHSFDNAIRKGIEYTNKWIKNTFSGFAQLFKKKNFEGMAGPIMIVAMTVKGAAAGMKIFLLLLAIISINLAILNIIPLPILDGGQMLFYSIEALIRRPIPNKVREYIHIATWLLFIALFIYLSTQDIFRIASPHIEKILKFIGLR